MWKRVDRAFFGATLALMAWTVVLTGISLNRTGGFLATVVLWLMCIGLLSLWVVATAGRLIVHRHVKPRQPDGPEADYHDPPPRPD
jgi:hypothetical protein